MKPNFFRLFFILFFFSANAFPVEVLSVHSMFRVRGGNGDDGNISCIDIWLYVKNEGEGVVRMPTKSIGYVISPGERKVFISISKIESPFGGTLVYSESALGVVSLHPGEVALIEFSTQLPDGCFRGRENVFVEYSVDDAVARRHKMWGGKISTEAKDSRDVWTK